MKFDQNNTFVISLPQAVNRRGYIQQHFFENGIDFQFSNAVDGNHISQSTLMSIYSPKDSLDNIYREMSKGEIGCALSHKKIWDMVIEKNFPYVLIFEDDVILDKNFHDTLNAAENLPKGWDIILLGHHQSQSRYAQSCFHLWSFIYKRYRKPIENNYGTYSYVLSHAGAIKLKEQSTLISKPIDHYTGNWKVLNLYAAYPVVARVIEECMDNIGISMERNLLTKQIKYPAEKKRSLLFRTIRYAASPVIGKRKLVMKLEIILKMILPFFLAKRIKIL